MNKRLLYYCAILNNSTCLRVFILLILFTVNINISTAQDKPGVAVSGIIRSEDGAPLQGVTVQEKGVKSGVSTDSAGVFKIRVVDENAELSFSYIGYAEQVIRVGSERFFSVTLKTIIASSEDVVVIAYGRQKRATLTGAIATVQGKDLVATSVSNVSNMLIGNIPGLSGLQTSGEPGRNGASIFIRGISTFSGNRNPLVVIDGVEQAVERAFDQLNAIDANEIENISVLKDASSTAVYGIRGANGVIIVTTKRGRLGKPTLSLSSNYGITKATNLMHNVSSYEYAMMRNEAINTEISTFKNSSFTNNLFSQSDLWKLQNNRDYTPEEVAAMTQLSQSQKDALNASPALYYGSRDLFAEQFGGTGPQKQINLNISGGTAAVKYFTSLGYFSQGSILNNTRYQGANTASTFDRYNFRSNFDINVIKNLQLSINLAGQFGITSGPGYLNGGANPYDLSARYKAIMQYIFDSDPLTAPGLVDGKLVNSYNGIAGSPSNPLGIKLGSLKGAQNPIRNLLASGTENLYNTLLSASASLRYNMGWLIKGLSLRTTFNYDDDYVKSIAYQPSLAEYSVSRDINDPNVFNFYGGARGANTFNTNPGHNSTWEKIYIDAGIEYNNAFGSHNIGALLLGKAQKYIMPSTSDNTPSGILGLLGRVTYNYKERYMLEFNVGYNGTEQFAEGKRFGFFPAYSAGWVISNEPFFPRQSWVTFLKLRASQGVVGNDQLGSSRRYLYLPSTFTTGGAGYYWGNSDGSSVNPYYSGSREGTIGNPDVTWEKAEKVNLGLDAKFIKDKLSFTAEYFKEKRDNILTTLGTIPYIYGVASSSVPPVNVGRTTNHGYEATLGWNDHANSINYMVLASLSYARNKIEYMAEAPKLYDWMNATGYSIGQYKGLIADGFYNTTEELNNRPYNKYNANQVALGDVRYVDINGDGFIDEKDVVPVGFSNLPQYSYSFKSGISVKGFDLSVLFTGTANGSFNLANYAFNTPFFQTAGNVMQWQYDGRWTPEKAAAGEEILYPRATIDGGTGGGVNFGRNSATSSLWIVSNNYFRLKNAELGYTFPNYTFLQHASISSVRIYINGNNLITWNKTLKDKGIDPESVDYGGYSLYPITRVFVAGINIRF